MTTEILDQRDVQNRVVARQPESRNMPYGVGCVVDEAKFDAMDGQRCCLGRVLGRGNCELDGVERVVLRGERPGSVRVARGRGRLSRELKWRASGSFGPAIQSRSCTCVDRRVETRPRSGLGGDSGALPGQVVRGIRRDFQVFHAVLLQSRMEASGWRS